MPNMEQEFKAWFVTQEKTRGKNKGENFTEADAKKFARFLNKDVPNKIGRSDTLLNETNVDIIEGLHQRFSKDGDLYTRDQKLKWDGFASNALSWYIKFLKSRNIQNDFSDTVETKEDEPITAELKEDKTMKKPLNQILYGPPGTGKTYSTVGEALKILEAADEQKQEIKSIKQLKEVFGSRIEFVTFHQSFSYEDFVEGLKAEVNDDGNLTYETQDGIFKIICESATNNDENNDSIKQLYEKIDSLKERLKVGPLRLQTLSEKTHFTLSLVEDEKWDFLAMPDNEENGFKIYRKSIVEQYKDSTKKGYALSYIYSIINSFVGLPKYQKTKKLKEQENDSLKLKKLHEALDKLKERLFKNPISEFKTVSSRKAPFTLHYIEGRKHPFQASPDDSKSKNPEPYECPIEHIEILYKNPNVTADELGTYGHNKGYTLSIINYLKSNLDLPEYQEIKKSHVLIIDEINRGNISRILGELITLIEPSKRAGADEEIEVTLPYSKEPFSVPDNLYIIGTMNTADRSLAQIDIALRRRFRFVEMMPKPHLLNHITGVINLRVMLENINKRIRRLLDREHQIGHSFFMEVASLDDLKETFQYEILPLLEEYFFENWENILEVLNDTDAEIFYTKITGNENSNTPYRKLTGSEWDKLDAESFRNIYL